MRTKLYWKYGCVLVLLVFFAALPQVAQATTPVVKTVPWDAANPTAPHTTYPLDATHEVTIILGATVDLLGSGNTFSYDWDFGDGSAHATGTVVDPYDVSTLHQYPASAVGGTTWTAVLKITDTNTGQFATANYYVIQQANNLQSRVNVAIDHGLWYMHKTMWRCANGVPTGCNTGGIYGANGVYGGWDNQSDSPWGAFSSGFYNCGVNGYAGMRLAYDCDDQAFSAAITGSNVQAFEVTGHLESGPASDPYTEDVMRGLRRVMMHLNPAATFAKNYANVYPACSGAPTAPCDNWVFDGNSNGQIIYGNLNDYANQPFYEGGQHLDAIVASGTPNAVATTGVVAGGGLPGVQGQTYKSIVQDMVDTMAACQYGGGSGGAWIYGCQGGNDNSVSQWEAIGLIAASTAFGVTIPTIVHQANDLWVTTDFDSVNGGFGYTQAGYYPWGPYATTPSGLVQMVMNAKGRGDTRWDKTETYYRNAFCNATSSGATVSPRAYTYGLFSFTKSMLLHNPAGVLTPITLLHSATSGVPDIDWYNAVGPESGGADACDGVAQTLVKRQGQGALTNGTPNPANPQGGYWYGNNYYFQQNAYETSWSIIMLRKTVFVACVNNLGGRGTPSGRAAARIDLTWTGVTGASSYNVLRGTAAGGPYTQVGNTTGLAFTNNTGLVNGQTYYYVLQLIGPSGGSFCQSNEVAIKIPAAGR